MKKCKTCGADIAQKAKVCPSCGAKQKKPTALIILGVIVLIFIVAAVFGDSNEPTQVGTVDPSASFAGTQSDSTQLVDQPDVFGVGDVVELDGVNVTLLSVTENNGSQFITPTDGNVFVLFEFDIDNQSDSDISVSSILSFEAYFDDYASSVSIGALSSTDKPQLDGSVAAGRKITGAVGYEAPANWAKAEIRYTPEFWSGGEIVFEYTK